MSVNQLIKRSVINAKREEASSDDCRADNALVITKIAKSSPAAAARVQEGDWLIEVDGRAASQVDYTTFCDVNKQHQYVFLQHRPRRKVVLTTTGAPMGILTRPTSEAIRKLTEQGKGVPSEYDQDLWESGEWDLLELVARDALSPTLVGRLISLVLRDIQYDHPCAPMLGAALYEKGQIEEGMIYINKYLDKYSSHYTVNYAAIALYYKAREIYKQGQREEAVELLERVLEYLDVDCVTSLYEQWTGRPKPPDVDITDTPFPTDYLLRELTSEREVELSETLGLLEPGRILFICLLGGYRTNGPYADWIKKFQRLHTFFPDIVSGMHVLTASKQPPEEMKPWMQAEEEAIRAGVPIRVLLDEHDHVAESMGIDSSPYVVALNNQGIIVHRNRPDDVEWWDMLAKLSSQK